MSIYGTRLQYLEGSMSVSELDLQMTFHQRLLKYMNSTHHLSEMRLLQYVPISRENVSLVQQRYIRGMICNSAGKAALSLISLDFIFFFFF